MSGLFEEQLREKLKKCRTPDRIAADECRRRWDTLAKPIDGLGRFEQMITRLAGIQETPEVQCRPAAAVVLCADHGVVCEGVTQTDSMVTRSVAQAVAEGRSTVNVLAGAVSADVFVFDIGMHSHAPVPGLRDFCVTAGTGNIAKEAAMSREEASLAVLRGMEIVEKLAEQGYRVLAAGEMGIGNTTPASAMAAVLTGLDPARVTGRGAGLPADLYAHKIEIVRKAVALHQPDPDDPLAILSSLGGLEIAGMAGLFLGGAKTGTAVIIDGFLSAVAAVLAQRMNPVSTEYMLASHVGREPASGFLLRQLDLEAVLDAGMALGEASGALLLLPLLDAALALYNKGQRFPAIDLEPYKRY